MPIETDMCACHVHVILGILLPLGAAESVCHGPVENRTQKGIIRVCVIRVCVMFVANLYFDFRL